VGVSEPDSVDEVRRLKAEARRRIDDVVTDRGFMRDTLRLDTLGEAIAAVTTRAGLRTYYAAHADPPVALDTRVLAIVVDSGHIVYGRFNDGDDQFWRNNDPQRSGPYPTPAEERLRVVRNFFDVVIDNCWPLTHLLSERYDPWEDGDRSHVEVTLHAWWDARMSEGHTPESARLLLSLTASPSLLGALTFPDTGETPTLAPFTLR
jgi:hypothetical protein